jgi:hypothetical protein
VTRLAATLLTVAAAGLAACGGGGESGASGLSRADAQDAGVKFARCMRRHGIDVPDPRAGAGGVRSLALTRDQHPQPGFAKARDACRRYLDGIASKVSDDQRQQIMDARLDLARCMRSKGFDVPDPRPGAALGTGGGPLGDLDLDDPRVAKALSACSKGLRTLGTAR